MQNDPIYQIIQKGATNIPSWLEWRFVLKIVSVYRHSKKIIFAIFLVYFQFFSVCIEAITK